MSVKVGKFPTLTELETVATLKKYDRLYCNEAMAVLGIHELIKKQYKNLADLVYISHAVPARISDFYGDFVAGDVDDLQIIADTGKEDDEKLMTEIVYENDLKERVHDFAVDQSEFGYVALYAYLDTDDKTLKIDAIPQDQYFPQSDGSVIVGCYKKDPNDVLGKKVMLYTQHFQVVNGKVTIERELFACDEKGVAIQPMALSALTPILGYEPLALTTIENLDELPIVQIDNGRPTKYGIGKSDYADVMPQLAEVNERTTQISTQFLKNMDAKMQLPSGMREADGTVKPFDTVFVEHADQPEAKYIVNTNSLVGEAQEHIMAQFRVISEVTGVPMWSLLKGSQPERVESLRIQMFNAIRKSDRKRAKLKRGLLDILRIGFKMKGQPLEQDPVIKFGDVLPRDENAFVDTEAAKVTAGLSSRRSAIMRIDNVNEEEAEEEMEQIREEDKIAGVTNPTPPELVETPPAK